MKVVTYIFIALFLIMAAAIAFASGFPYLQAKLSPMAVGSVILFLAAVEAIRELFSSKKSATTEEVRNATEPAVRRGSYLIEVTWVTGLVLGICLVGFLIAILLFGVSYMRSHGAKWSIAAMVATLLTIFCWVLFSYLLEAHLYPGLIFKWLGW